MLYLTPIFSSKSYVFYIFLSLAILLKTYFVYGTRKESNLSFSVQILFSASFIYLCFSSTLLFFLQLHSCSFIPFWSEDTHCMILVFLSLIRLVLCLTRMHQVAMKNMVYYVTFDWRVPYMSVISNWSMVEFGCLFSPHLG